MSNILKKYKKEGIIEIGTDKRKLDSPEHETIFIGMDFVAKKVSVLIKHDAMQGTLKNPHERTIDVEFSNLPSSVKAAGKAFFDAIEIERLKRPEYVGSTEV
jgi:hypothetical protein